MKRVILLTFTLCSFAILYAQERVSVAEYLSKSDAKDVPYAVKGTFDQMLSSEDLVFTVKDSSGVIRVKLFQNGSKTALYFHAMNFCPGDTVIVAGKRGTVRVKGMKSEQGINPGSVLSKVDSPNHELFGASRPPSFQGKGMAYFSKWVNRHLKYPPSSLRARSQGTVVVNFTINEDGRLTDIKIVSSSGDSALDEEALRVISMSPLWFPGTIDGEPVSSTHDFPIEFYLADTNQTIYL